MKIAIVHDFLNQYGGAERVIETLHEVFPEAPVFTTICLPDQLPESFRTMDIRTSFMQKLPFLNKHFKKYLMLYPRAMETLDVHGFDIILSSSSAFAKGIRKDARALHVCYCYTPMRFAWDYERYIEKENVGWMAKAMLPSCLRRLRGWDLMTNSSVNHFISISKNIENRIRKYYNRESTVIYPPVNTDRFGITDGAKKHFLIVSRLNAYKRIDIVVEAFNILKLPLRIVGDGPYRKELEKMANDNVQFTGRLDEKDLITAYEECRAFIFPGEEDFGIAPVEAQAAGRPVIAFAGGGALETVNDGISGVFFNEQTSKSVADAVRRFVATEHVFVPEIVRRNAIRFDKEVFKDNIRKYVVDVYSREKSRG